MMRLFFSGRSMTRPFFFGLFVMLDTLDLGKTKKQTRKKDHESSRFNADPTSLKVRQSRNDFFNPTFLPKN